MIPDSFQPWKQKVGESESRWSKVTGEVVHVHHVTKHSDGTLYIMDWKFDYTDVTPEERMLEAARAHVIDYRPGFKKAKGADLDQYDDMTINVRKDSTVSREMGTCQYQAV